MEVDVEVLPLPGGAQVPVEDAAQNLFQVLRDDVVLEGGEEGAEVVDPEVDAPAPCVSSGCLLEERR